MGRIGSKQGAALVEFALIVVLLMTLVFGMIDFGLAIRSQLALNQIAREATRTAALGGNPQTTVDDWAGRLGLRSAQIGVTTGTEGTAPNMRSVVTLTYPHHWIVGGLIGLTDRDLAATMVMRKE